MGPKKGLTRRGARLDIITVSCTDHHETMVEGLWNYWRAKRGVDVNFKWGDRSFEAHQIVVDIFLSQKKLDQAGRSQTVTDQGDIINSLLEFMYNGSIRIAKERLDLLLDVAKQVDFTMLVKALQKIKDNQPPKCTCPHHGSKSGSYPTRGKSTTTAKNVKGILKLPSKPSADRQLQLVEFSDEDDVGEDAVESVTPCEQLGSTKRQAVVATTKKSNAMVDVETGRKSGQSGLRRNDESNLVADAAAIKQESDEESHDDNSENGAGKHGTGPSAKRTNLATATRGSKRGRSTTQVRRGGRKRWRIIADLSPVRRDSEDVNAAETTNYSTESKISDDVKYDEDDAKLVNAEEVQPLPQDVFTSLPMLECTQCDYKTTEFLSHINHVNTAHKAPAVRPSKTTANQMQCRLCEFACEFHSELKAHHSATHPGEKAFKCPTCDETFNRRSNLNIHAEDCPGVPRRGPRPVCEICGRVFLTNYKLGMHMSRHRGERLFMCDVCGKGLSTAHSLSIHSRVHTGEKPYVCETCGRSFSDRTTLKRHLVLHVPNSPRHACHVCSRSFKRADALNLHIKQLHTEGYVHVPRRTGKGGADNGKPRRSNWRTGVRRTFVCRVCLDPPVQGFRTEMERHQKTEHQKGEKIFGCDQCEFRTCNIPMLAVHDRLHTGERPYKCDQCGRAFRDPSNYRGHLKYHARGEKSFRCIICGHTFHLRGNLKFHLKKVHRVEGEEVEAVLNAKFPDQETETEGGGGELIEVAEEDEDGEPETHDVIVHVDGVLDLADPTLVYFVT